MYNTDALCIDLPVLIKARYDGDRRLVELQASSEDPDGEGDVIKQAALLDSADSFIACGQLDLEHLAEIGYDLGIPNPETYVVGVPLEVKDLGGGCTGVLGQIHKGREQADKLWAGLTASPPEIWRASIYGFPKPGMVQDCRVSKNDLGATRFIVSGLEWKSLAFTRTPVNDAIKGNARVVTAKSFTAIMKSRSTLTASTAEVASPITDYILPPRNIDDLLGHFVYHIKGGKCPVSGGPVGNSVKSFSAHFQTCCGEATGDADRNALALTHLLKHRKSDLLSIGETGKSVLLPRRSNFSADSQRGYTVMADKISQNKLNKFLSAAADYFGKAVPTDKLPDLQGPAVEDMFPDGYHENISAAEVVTGPSEPMSGRGAFKMVGEYSDPAPQQGLTQQYQALSGLTAEFRKAMARLDKHERAITAVAGSVSGIQKAINEALAAAKAETPAQHVEDTFLGKAAAKLAKARKDLRKAEMADEEDKEERAERKSFLTSAQDLLKSAEKFLKKAEDEDEKEEEVEKALGDLKTLRSKVTKALAVITKAEDEEREEEKKREEEAAEKAKRADAEVKKADEKETEEEEKKDDTAKANAVDLKAIETLAAQMKAAVEGYGVMESTLKGLMETVAGRSRGSSEPPVMTKSVIAVDFDARLNEATNSGDLTFEDMVKAQTLNSRLAMARNGVLNVEDVNREIAKSPEIVRDLFKAAA